MHYLSKSATFLDPSLVMRLETSFVRQVYALVAETGSAGASNVELREKCGVNGYEIRAALRLLNKQKFVRFKRQLRGKNHIHM